MAEGLKLTKPQAALLTEIAKRPQSASESYPPLVRLMTLGLIEKRRQRLSDTYHITEAGRLAIKEA